MNLKFFLICQAVLIYQLKLCCCSFSFGNEKIDEINREILKKLDSEWSDVDWKDDYVHLPLSRKVTLLKDLEEVSHVLPLSDYNDYTDYNDYGFSSLLKKGVNFWGKHGNTIGNAVKCAKPFAEKVFNRRGGGGGNHINEIRDYSDDGDGTPILNGIDEDFSGVQVQVSGKNQKFQINAQRFLKEIHESMTRSFQLNHDHEDYANFIRNVVLPALRKSIQH